VAADSDPFVHEFPGLGQDLVDRVKIGESIGREQRIGQ